MNREVVLYEQGGGGGGGLYREVVLCKKGDGAIQGCGAE